MGSALNGTGLTFSSGQTLNSVPVTTLNSQSGAITTTDLYSLGSFVIGRPAVNSQYAVNSTIAGSSLYALSTTTYWSGSAFVDGLLGGPVSTLVNTGSWRCVSPSGGASGSWGSGLWVRYA
jgi:hypothetical protein